MPLGMYFVQPDIYGNCRECEGHTHTTSAWGCVVCFNYLGQCEGLYIVERATDWLHVSFSLYVINLKTIL